MATRCPERVVLVVTVVLCAQTNLVAVQDTSTTPSPTSSLSPSPTNTTTKLPPLSSTYVQSSSPITSAASSTIMSSLSSSDSTPTLKTQSSTLNTSTATSPITPSTFSPTTSPTTSPNTSSTFSPTTSSTFSPNTSSTFSPNTSSTFSPTTSPNTSSTFSPNTSPTFSPTTSPNTSSTFSPTTSPNTSSAFSPTTSPNTSSTFSPTTSPNTSSTFSPTNTSPSTFPVTNGKSPSTSSTTLPVYPGAHGYNVNSGALNVSLNFTIKFNIQFNPDLHNRSSSAFQEAEHKYTIMLTPIFNKTDSFDRIEITKFWNGSTGVSYTVVFHASDVTNLQHILENDTEKNLNNLEDVDTDYIRNVFQGEKASAIEKLTLVGKDLCYADIPCNPFFTCKTESQGNYITCKSPCEGFPCNEPYGSCELNSTGKPMCRCTSDNRYVYGGDDCSKKGETLKLSSEYIIGIGGGVGGGVVLILVIALIVTCCRRSKPDSETDRKSVESFRSDINDTTHAKDRSGSSAYQDPYNQPYERRYENMRRQDSGLPEQDKFEADFRSSAPRAPDAAARSDKPSFQRMQRETNEVTVYSPEVSPFFRNQAYESFPEPGHFTAARQGEVYPSRGVQRPFQRQPSDAYNPLVHSTAYPSGASASRPMAEEEAPARHDPLASHPGKWSYEASALKPKPVSRDNYGFEDRTRYAPEPRLDRPSAGVPIPYLRPPGDVDPSARVRGQIFDYTAGPRKA